METVIKTKTSGATKKQPANVQYQEPKRLSKVAQWLRDNPGERITVIDRRAVNK